jgi:nucleotide-binding universal stress UspA family protein
MTPHGTFVVGYDGSSASTGAVRWAARRAAVGGRLIVVHARRTGVPAPIHAESRDRARAGLEALWMQEAALIDAEVELRIADDSPARALVRTAREVGAEAIVVGRHHEGPFSADTVRQLLRESDRPVTVVP